LGKLITVSENPNSSSGSALFGFGVVTTNNDFNGLVSIEVIVYVALLLSPTRTSFALR
jgi:hypothetical protein